MPRAKPRRPWDAKPRRPWDAIVVGGGVVGCAVLRELTVNLGWRVLMVEASPHLAAGASSGNTGIACTASDVDPGTLEHACLVEGTLLNLPAYRALNVPHRASGSMYVGHCDAELAALAAEQAARRRRGDHSTLMLTASEARVREPRLGPTVAGALYIPSETVVDPWLVPLAYATCMCVCVSTCRPYASRTCTCTSSVHVHVRVHVCT